MIKWNIDSFEPNSIWQRKTFSWNNSSLKNIYYGKYKNLEGKLVIGTLLPISFGLSKEANWAILMETPVDKILLPENYLKHVFYIFGFLPRRRKGPDALT